MKQSKKSFKILVSMMMLLFALICVTGFTYSYFTSTSSTGGQVQMKNMDVVLTYTDHNGNLNNVNEPSVTLYSTTTAISTGVPFTVSTVAGGEAVQNISIRSAVLSCDYFVRFWFDVYVVDSNGNVDKSVNYGKYFVLPEEGTIYYTNQGSSVANSTCYFGKEVLNTYKVLNLGNTLILKDETLNNNLIALLGETIQISLSFEAVQKDNQAYLSVFGDKDDTKGYYINWKNFN